MQAITLAQSVIIKSSCQKFRSYFTFSVCLTYCTQKKDNTKCGKNDEVSDH